MTGQLLFGPNAEILFGVAPEPAEGQIVAEGEPVSETLSAPKIFDVTIGALHLVAAHLLTGEPNLAAGQMLALPLGMPDGKKYHLCIRLADEEKPAPVEEAKERRIIARYDA